MVNEFDFMVGRQAARPPQAHIDALAAFGTATLADAQEAPRAITGLRFAGGLVRFAGPALTVELAERDNGAAFAALRFCRPGDVIMLATGGCTKSAVVGGLFAGLCANAGLAGVITDGLCRDTDGIEASGLPVLSAGRSPLGPLTKRRGRIRVPVTIGGVAVEPGDVVVADRDGIVIVAATSVADLCTAAQQIRDREARIEAMIATGLTLPEWVEDLEFAEMGDADGPAASEAR